MLPSFARQSVKVVRAPYKDSRGTKVRDWSGTLAKTEVKGCEFQPVTSDTAWTDPAQAVTIDARLWMPAGTDIQPDDRVEVGSDVYAVQGAPKVWQSPTGAVDHIECDLVRWAL